MYCSVRKYRMDPARVEELMHRVDEGFAEDLAATVTLLKRIFGQGDKRISQSDDGFRRKANDHVVAPGVVENKNHRA